MLLFQFWWCLNESKERIFSRSFHAPIVYQGSERVSERVIYRSLRFTVSFDQWYTLELLLWFEFERIEKERKRTCFSRFFSYKWLLFNRPFWSSKLIDNLTSIINKQISSIFSHGDGIIPWPIILNRRGSLK